MFEKKQRELSKIEHVDTVVGQNSEFHGTISTRGSLRIEGIVDGDIENAEGVVIGQNGQITGNINSQSVVVGGKVIGNITAASTIEIHTGAHVAGDLKAPQFSINPGAFFEGSCAMPASTEGKPGIRDSNKEYTKTIVSESKTTQEA
jgi:cytoskeletal protein CcmA (bactofilin family)